MRLTAGCAVALVLAGSLSACVHPVDPVDAGRRAFVGAEFGAGLGTAVGSIVSLNPGIGSIVGAESGAAIGAAIGIATAAPAPTYKPVAAPDEASVPGFYDTWAPGYNSPPLGTETPPRPSSG